MVLEVDKMMILQWVLKEFYMRMWIVLRLLRKASNGSLVWTQKRIVLGHIRQEIHRPS
jgi:hypothetical protein